MAHNKLRVQSVLWEYLLNLFVISVIVSFGVFLAYWTPFVYPLQVIETYIVYWISHILGYPVTLNSDLTSLSYGAPLSHRIIIAPACTAFVEMMLVSAGIMLLDKGTTARKVKLSLAASVLVFVENIIRMILTYPLVSAFGYAKWSKIHYIWWKFGQILFIILILVVIYGLYPLYRSRMDSTSS